MPQAMKIPDTKAAVDKECEKLEKLPAWQLNNEKNKREVIKAAVAVSAYTQVKSEDAPKLFRIPKSECPDTSVRLPWHKWPV